MKKIKMPIRSILLVFLALLFCTHVMYIIASKEESWQQMLGKKSIEYIIKKERYREESQRLKEERDEKREVAHQKYRKKNKSWVKKRNKAARRWKKRKASLGAIRVAPDRVRMQKCERRLYEWIAKREKSAKKWESKREKFLKSIGKEDLVSGR